MYKIYWHVFTAQQSEVTPWTAQGENALPLPPSKGGCRQPNQLPLPPSLFSLVPQTADKAQINTEKPWREREKLQAEATGKRKRKSYLWIQIEQKTTRTNEMKKILSLLTLLSLLAENSSSLFN